MKSFSIPSPIAWAGSGDTRLLKSKELQRTRTGPAQKKAMTLLCFVWGQPRLLKGCTYTCFIRRNRLSPARHWACLSQGKNCHCSIFCRDMAHGWCEAALPAELWQPHSSLQLTSRLGHPPELGLWACQQADVLGSCPQPGIPSQHGHEEAGRAARAGECLPPAWAEV